MKFAAIDIGSNAVRLLFNNVYERPGGPVFYKDSIIRTPVRLGEEAFLEGLVSGPKIDDLVKTMIAYRQLIEVHKVVSYRACATSAMRIAKNGKAIADLVRKEANIDIEIISGAEEASLILSRDFQKMLDLEANNYLYIDVGGGSTEMVFFTGGKIASSRSFEIGTLRLLNRTVTGSDWKSVETWLKTNKSSDKDVIAIGSGGNINKLMKMYGNPDFGYLEREKLMEVFTYLKELTMQERIVDLGLKPDRADVIIPAISIFLQALNWVGAEKVIVPQFGLSDGIVRQLYNSYIDEKSMPLRS